MSQQWPHWLCQVEAHECSPFPGMSTLQLCCTLVLAIFLFPEAHSGLSGSKQEMNGIHDFPHCAHRAEVDCIDPAPHSDQMSIKVEHHGHVQRCMLDIQLLHADMLSTSCALQGSTLCLPHCVPMFKRLF